MITLYPILYVWRCRWCHAWSPTLTQGGSTFPPFPEKRPVPENIGILASNTATGCNMSTWIKLPLKRFLLPAQKGHCSVLTLCLHRSQVEAVAERLLVSVTHLLPCLCTVAVARRLNSLPLPACLPLYSGSD